MLYSWSRPIETKPTTEFPVNIVQQKLAMIPLKTNRRVLQWFCVYPANESDSLWIRFAYICFALFMLAINIIVIVVSITFFIRFASTNLEEALFTVIQLAGIVTMTYVMIITFFQRFKIIGIFKSLENIYKICKSRFQFGFMK